VHDLNTINRLNAETLGATAQHLRAQGRWVILRKDGLHFTSVESFSTHQEAMNAYLHQVDKTAISESLSLLAPTTTTPATGLDATVNPELGTVVGTPGGVVRVDQNLKPLNEQEC